VLPDASPTPSTMYAPRGVCLTDGAVVVADTGNHRILIWHEPLPGADHQDADVVVGQPDMTTEGPGLLFLPTGVMVTDGRLVVADAWHHRILVWDELPTTTGVAPSMVLGQSGLDGVDEGCGPQRFYWPFGIAMVDGCFWVGDTGNRRVLGWRDGLPGPGRPADVVLGQPSFEARGENRDGPVSACSLRWPHAITSAGGTLFVADAGNHRVLGWRGDVSGDRAADIVIGQPSFASATEFPYRPQGPRSFRFPYAVTASEAGALFIADTSNNRVAVIDEPTATLAAEPEGAAVDRVLGQADFDANGENRWDRVEHDTFCWPYGLDHHGDRLAIADSGNNRAMIWRVGS
jgi:DNA-binding beta-propeller fold protein YncE